ncbi:MAG: Prophage regulatory [Proteobacteria bacterium]|nr:Prophage regulatory [Pseudomonadota bacterium]
MSKKYPDNKLGVRKVSVGATFELPRALREFDNLPDSAHVRKSVLEFLYSCSGSTVIRRVHDGLLPAPHKLSPRISAWNVGELRRNLASKKGE